MRKIFMKEEPGLNPLVSALFVFLSSIALTFAAFYLQHYQTEEFVYGLQNSGGLTFVLNFLPIFWVMMFLFFASGSFSISFSIVAAVTLILTLINRFKIILRQDPLVPSDFYLKSEAFTIVMQMDTMVIVKSLVLLLAIILFCILFVYFVRTRKYNPIIRCVGSTICLAVILILNNTVYSSSTLSESLPVHGEELFIVNIYNTKGFVYSFMYEYNTNRVRKPEGYQKDALLTAIESKYPMRETQQNSVQPHIVMIMGEAFSDIATNPSFDFTGYTDPLKNFKALKRESVSGHILVPHLGGGTADIEFNILTGMSKGEFDSVPYAFRLLSKNTESFASGLADLGYHNIFLHPGFSWFYNRLNAYDYLGFNDLHFIDDYYGSSSKGKNISEKSTIDMIIKTFSEKLEETPGTPIFSFCVSIQNHGPYENKYKDLKQNFTSAVSLTESDINAFSNYFEGVADQDSELKRLTDYLNSLDEPVALLYFGDHFPGFSLELYDALGFPSDLDGTFAERTFLYKTPYLMWQNKAYKRQLDFNQQIASLKMPADMTINSSFLGSLFLETMGFENVSPFMSFVGDLRREFPIMTKWEYTSLDGSTGAVAALPPNQKEMIDMYRYWQYYRMFDD